MDLSGCVIFSQVTSVGKPSLSVLFYTVRLSYSRWFAAYVDAAVSPELEPDTAELQSAIYSESGNRLLSWADVPTAARYVDTVGIFIGELLMQSQLDNLTHDLQTRSVIGRRCSFTYTHTYTGLTASFPRQPG